jgi:hypothetical protein
MLMYPFRTYFTLNARGPELSSNSVFSLSLSVEEVASEFSTVS